MRLHVEIEPPLDDARVLDPTELAMISQGPFTGSAFLSAASFPAAITACEASAVKFRFTRPVPKGERAWIRERSL